MLSNVTSVKAETYLIGIKDHAEQGTKKKSKKVKKSKKKTKKSKRVKKNNKKKDIGTVKVVSASSLYTNHIDDLSTVDYQKAVISVFRSTKGSIERLPFLDKFVTNDNAGVVTLLADNILTGFVRYEFDGCAFEFIDSNNLSLVEIYGLYNENTLALDKDLVIKKFLNVGIDISFSRELLIDMVENEKSYNLKLGGADWTLTCRDGALVLQRVIKPVDVHHRDAYKAMLEGRLNITPSFHKHLLTLLNTTNVLDDDKSGVIALNLKDGNLFYDLFTEGAIITRLLFADLSRVGRTELRIGGYVNPETAVDDLTRILNDYCGFDFK